MGNVLVSLANREDCDRVRALLSGAGISFQEIDARKTGVLPFLGRDLGVETIPSLIAGGKSYEGEAEIAGYVQHVTSTQRRAHVRSAAPLRAV